MTNIKWLWCPRKYRRKIIIFTALFLGTFWLFLFIFSPLDTKPSGSLVRLGNPLLEDGKSDRALNVWDLQVFEGKIYLGGGSTVTNAGPINVWAYDPVTQKFNKEYQVSEEAIEHFKVFENRLYIPAADPRQGDNSKFYRKSANNHWTKYTSKAVKLAHVRDMIKTDTKEILLVGNNRNLKNVSNPGAAITKDDGFSFQGAGVKNVKSDETVLVDYNWFFSVFKYQDTIYATSSLLRDIDDYSGSISTYNPEIKEFQINFDLSNHEFIPKSSIGKKHGEYGINIIYRLWNPIEFQGFLFYPVRSYSNNNTNYEQAYMNSIGFYYKQDMGKTPEAIKLPHRALGEDVLIIDNELYILANKKRKADKFIVYVYKTDQINNKIKWHKVLQFTSFNKARSFEYLDGKFYFGLGQDYGEKIANSGDVLSYTSDYSLDILQKNNVIKLTN